MKAVTQRHVDLPQGVGKLTPTWIAFFAAMAVISAMGAAAWSYQLNDSLIVTGLRNLGTGGGSPWGLYVAMDVYFVGVSFAGITIAAMIRLFDLARLRPVARIAESLTVVSLILAGFTIMADLGQPLRGFINLFRYARPQSPFFGTFALVLAGYMFSSLVYLYLASRKDAAALADYENNGLRWYHRLLAMGYKNTPEERERHRATSFWLALAIIPLLIIAHSTLGFVFGLQVGRPGWFSALQAPAFVALAGVSGIGLIIVFAFLVRLAIRGEDRLLPLGLFSMLGRFLMVLLFVYLYFMVVELLTLTYASPATEQRLSDALLFGRYAPVYWGAVIALVGSAVALGIMALRRSWSLGWLVGIGVAVNLAAIAKRYLIVVPSQTHGMLLPYDVGTYWPNWVEVMIIIGLFAFGALLLGVFVKTFPAVPISDDVPSQIEEVGRA